MMTYSNFEIRLLMALVDSADASERGQCEAFEVAETVLPQVKDQWVTDAVRYYEQRGYIGPISRPGKTNRFDDLGRRPKSGGKSEGADSGGTTATA